MSYITMNRFKVLKGHEEEFEAIWLGRETFLDEVPGFQSFKLLKGPERDDHVLYASHSVWASKDAFEAWTKSEAFRKAHAGAGQTEVRSTYAGAPELETFEVLQEV